MITNKLKINDSKTEFIVLRSPQLRSDLSGLSVNIDKEILQKYKYELNLQLEFTQMNEFTCNHTQENYNCQIQLLHDHLINSCIISPNLTPSSTGIKLGGMSTLAKSSIMNYIGIDCIFNIAVRNLVLSLKCENLLGLYITRKSNLY